jgi:hypothetical protein
MLLPRYCRRSCRWSLDYGRAETAARSGTGQRRAEPAVLPAIEAVDAADLGDEDAGSSAMPRTKTSPGMRPKSCHFCLSCSESNNPTGASCMRSAPLIATLALILVGVGCSAPEHSDTSSTSRSPTGTAADGQPPGGAPKVPAPAMTDFHNVRIFDGHSDRLSAPSNVRVKGDVIERISTDPLPAEPGIDATVIDGGGRTLMPGLIDNHWHTMFVRPLPAQALASGLGYLNLVAGAEAGDTLMRGFTTVRDLGGPSFDLKRAIDEGAINGPRIFPSGAMITVTSGHGDFRTPADLPRSAAGSPSHQEEIGASAVADSRDEVRQRTREQLFQGAS